MDCSDAVAFTGEIDLEDCADTALRSHIFQDKMIELRLTQSMQETHDLRGAPFVIRGSGEVEDSAKADSAAPKAGANGGRWGKQK